MPRRQPAAAAADSCKGEAWRDLACSAAAHPRAISSDLMSFLIFQISMLASFFTSSALFSSDMLTWKREQTALRRSQALRSPQAGAAVRVQLGSHV